MKPYFDEDGITIYCGDCREILPGLEHAGIKAVFTDPNYGETALEWDQYSSDWIQMLPESVRQVWCFGSMRFFLTCAAFFISYNWRFAQELVWEKQNGSGFCVDRFNRVHEYVFHWYRGKWDGLTHNTPRLDYQGPRKVIKTRGPTPHRGITKTIEWEEDGRRIPTSVVRFRNAQGYAEHPTQKPLSLLDLLISYSTKKKDVLCDPFLGSGTTLVAAKQLGLRAIGIELQEKYCEVAAKRLAQNVFDFAAEADAGQLPVEVTA